MLKRILVFLIALWPLVSFAVIDDLVKNLKEDKDYEAQINVTVTLPTSTNDEVTYIVKAASVTANVDSLLDVAYLIDWTLPTALGESHGFSSYFDGNFYRYRDGGSRLQEYHIDVTPDLFNGSLPIQLTGQFIEVLPVSLAKEIQTMVADSTYKLKFSPDTIFKGTSAQILKVRRIVNDLEVGNMLYVFEKNTLSPLFIEKEMSPGTISEQTVTYSYVYNDNSPITVPVNEQQLISIYPEAFANFREGTYGVKSLQGKKLPPFSLSTIDGERFTHNRNESFTSPILLVFIDETVSTTTQVIKDLREAVSQMPINTDILWIFLSNRHDDIIELLQTVAGKSADSSRAFRLPAGEQIMISGRNIVQDFGITETPTIIAVNEEGNVIKSIVGYNQNLISDVINIRITN